MPLAYPALLYLLGRALWMGFRGGEGLRPSIPARWLVVATLFLVGFRVGLNIADSNVIDVGYSGVIGADRIADGKPLYGDFPTNNPQGDTYGPVAYYAYVPFEQALPWSGNWDDLPAAHAAAIFFDLATIAGLVAFGRRLRPGREGRRLGATLGLRLGRLPLHSLRPGIEHQRRAGGGPAWSACLAGPQLTGPRSDAGPSQRHEVRPLGPGAAVRDLRATPDAGTATPSRGDARCRGGSVAAHEVRTGFIALTRPSWSSAQTIIDPGISSFWDRTIGYQVGRDSPFSIWGQTSLGPLHTIVDVLVGALAILVAFFPRRRDPVTVAALGAAVLIAFELTVDHWFYLYLPWFLPFLFIALVGRGAAPARSSRPALAR